MDWEYSEDDCPKCQSQLAWRSCAGCGGDGFVDTDEGEDWANDTRCDHCNGRGDEEWCRECGWDVNFNCFLSPEYERAFLEKQAQDANAGSGECNR